MGTLVYSDEHDAIFKAAGTTLDQVIQMGPEEQNTFISANCNPHIVDGDELEWAAEDVIDMIKYWEPGQRQETL